MSNALAVVNGTKEVSSAMDLFPSAQELALVKEQAAIYVKSGLLPKAIDTPEKAILIMLKGRELGIPPLQALSGIYVVDGKPTMGAELMLTQIRKLVAGARIEFAHQDEKSCVIQAARPGENLQTFSFTIEDAQKAGVLAKDNWRKYPKTMLRWRAISIMAKSLFSDAVAGCYTPDELGAEVDDKGNIVRVPDVTGDKAKALSELVHGKPIEKEVEVVVTERSEPTPAPTPAELVENIRRAAGGTVVPEPKAAQGELPSDDGGDFVVPFGKQKGTALRDLTREEIQEKINWVNTKATKPLSKGFVDFLAAAEYYLANQVFQDDAP
jgi:hypothetical protein